MSEKIPADIMAAANATVESIFTDLRDRRFLKWLFDERGEECFIDTFKDGKELRGLDLEVQEEIKAAWAKIIAGEEVTAEYVAGPKPRFSPERPYGITIITDDEPIFAAPRFALAKARAALEPAVGIDWKSITAKIAHHVTRMNREDPTALALGEAIARDCNPLFEALGMSFDDGWFFSEDDTAEESPIGEQ